MTHTVHYGDAATRHYRDAKLLRDSERVPNSDHLLGLAAECGLKWLMIHLGVASHPTQGIAQPYRVHINTLWNEAASFAQRRQGAAILSAIVSAANPFVEWRVEERYLADTSHPACDAQRLERHANAATNVLQAMEVLRVLGGVT